MMKKRWILLMMCACISGLGGCGKQTVTEKAEETETADSMKEDTTELCAYIKEINGNTLVIDPVEYISSGDIKSIVLLAAASHASFFSILLYA